MNQAKTTMRCATRGRGGWDCDGGKDWLESVLAGVAKAPSPRQQSTYLLVDHHEHMKLNQQETPHV